MLLVYASWTYCLFYLDSLRLCLFAYQHICVIVSRVQGSVCWYSPASRQQWRWQLSCALVNTGWQVTATWLCRPRLSSTTSWSSQAAATTASTTSSNCIWWSQYTWSSYTWSVLVPPHLIAPGGLSTPGIVTPGQWLCLMHNVTQKGLVDKGLRSRQWNKKEWVITGK